MPRDKDASRNDKGGNSGGKNAGGSKGGNSGGKNAGGDKGKNPGNYDKW